MIKYKYQVKVEGSIDTDGVYFVVAENRREACYACERENNIRNSQSGTTYTAINIGEEDGK